MIRFAVLCWVVMAAVGFGLAYAVFPAEPAIYFGLVIASGAVVWTLEWFTASVPEATGLLLVNVLKSTRAEDPFSNQRGVGPGLHFKLPWEQGREGNYINLRLITPPTRDETYPSAEGPMMKVKWSFQYRPNVELLPQYIGVDESTIDDGIADMGSSFLSREIGGQSVEKIKNLQGDIEGKLLALFDTGKKKLEYLYGINVMKAALHDVDYEESYQAALAAKAIAARVNEIAKDAPAGLHPKDAANHALVIAGKATKQINEQINEVRGEGAEALAAFLAGILGGNKGGG